MNELSTWFGVVSALFGLYAGFLLVRHLRLLARGICIEGVVRDTVMDANGGAHHLLVEYRDAKGDTFRLQSRASFLGWQNEVGRTVRLRYLASRPEVVYIEKDLVVQYVGALLMALLFAGIAIAKLT